MVEKRAEGGGGGGGGGGVDLALDFKNFWDGVYNFFFAPSPRLQLFIKSTTTTCKSHKMQVVGASGQNCSGILPHEDEAMATVNG